MRSAQASVYIRATVGGEPLVEVTRVTRTLPSFDAADDADVTRIDRVSGENKLVFKATVTAPVNTSYSEDDDGAKLVAEGVVVWGVNGGSGLDLDLASASPLTKEIRVSSMTDRYVMQDFDPVQAPSTIVLYLVVRPNQLQSLAPYTFTLTYTSNDGTVVTSSKAIVTANSAPTSGFVDVLPAMGSELKTIFTIGAALWDDTDLPLTYQYYLVDPYDTTTTVAIRSRNEDPELETVLPAGYYSNSTSNSSSAAYSAGNASLEIGALVFDSLDAHTASSVIVEVLPREMSALDIEDYFTFTFAAAESAEEVKLAVVTTTMKSNVGDCSHAPNCTALNRLSCKAIDSTCGACMDGHFPPRVASTVGLGMTSVSRLVG